MLFGLCPGLSDNTKVISMTDKQQPAPANRRLSVAPMMDWTDRHCRYFHRLLAPSAWLYTEMVTTGAILHGDQPRHLDFDDAELPVALQLGGSNPHELAQCARIGEQWGYSEINLNVGCPSDRVQRGVFGACLMKQPPLVRDCLAAMQDAVSVPVTIKTRIGVDDYDSWDFLRDFVGEVARSGVSVFILHARKAWLSGLSPKQNREIPALEYDKAQRVKQTFPELQIIVNGGITCVEDAHQHLAYSDGVMLGRAAYQTPWVLSQCQQALFADAAPLDRTAVMQKMIAYCEQQQRHGVKPRHIGRHLLGLYHAQPGARIWRRWMSDCLQRNAPASDWLEPFRSKQIQAA